MACMTSTYTDPIHYAPEIRVDSLSIPHYTNHRSRNTSIAAIQIAEIDVVSYTPSGYLQKNLPIQNSYTNLRLSAMTEDISFYHDAPGPEHHRNACQIEVVTIIPSDIIDSSSSAELEFVASSLAALLRTSGVSFSGYGRRTDWTRLYHAIDDSYRDEPLIIPSGHGTAIWTRLSRTLVDPEVLMEAGEAFDVKVDSVIIRREMTRREVVELVKKSMKWREQKEAHWIASERRSEGAADGLERGPVSCENSCP